jgi:hypothetical protein
MAVKGNDSSVNTVHERINKIGPILLKVLAINPTLSELNNTLGYKSEKEPEYLSEGEGGVKKCRLDIYVQGKDEPTYKSKITIFLEDKQMKAKSGNFGIMNNYLQGYFGDNVVWKASIEEAIAMTGKNGNTWFKADGARIAFQGEGDLYKFIMNWSNTDTMKEDCVLEDTKALFKGNFKELQGLVKLLANNYFWGMAEVTEKGYQQVNNKVFGKPLSKQFVVDFAKFAKEQKEAGYALKNAWATEFKEYVPVPVFADPEPGSVVGETTTEVDF